MPRTNYISVVFSPDGGKRSLAFRLRSWQLAAILSAIIIGWVFLFAGMTAGVFFVQKMGEQKALLAENRRLREAVGKLDTLRQELYEIRSMRVLMERALLAADKKIANPEQNYQYMPSGMTKSSIFLPNKGLPELSEYLDNQARIHSYVPTGMPANGVVSAHFGDIGGVFKTPHSGIDIVAPIGTPVRATAHGIIAKVGENEDYGVFVVIDHMNGYKTLYAHLSQATVNPGSPVKRDFIIGYSGKTGKTYNPHVHYEVDYYDKPINPLTGATEDTSAVVAKDSM